MAVTHAPHRRIERTAGRDGPPRTVDYVWAATRLSIGFVFAWAFLDKTFGLGHDTTSAQAWIHGGSPTTGFLSHSTGPFAGLFSAMAGNTAVDWLFMLALLGLGVALLLGIGMRVAAAVGVLLLVGMWAAALPPANNLFMDDHLIYALTLVGLALVAAGDTLGLGRPWSRLRLVARNSWLS
jgi:thiosulfate dehydrogenase (quinone) large subunit